MADFVSSGMRRSEFCQSRGLSFSTLDRHLKKLRWKRRRKPISSAGRLVPVELAARKSPKQQEPSCGLAVVLPVGRRIEVHPDFDTSTFERRIPLLCPRAHSARRASMPLTLWKKLTGFLEYPALERSTNLAENSMRPVALGRSYVHSRIMYSGQSRL